MSIIPFLNSEKDQSSVNLHENPLALALESLHDFTLKLSSVASLDTLIPDSSGEIHI